MSERDKSCHQDLANVPPSFREGKLTSTQVEEKRRTSYTDICLQQVHRGSLVITKASDERKIIEEDVSGCGLYICTTARHGV